MAEHGIGASTVTVEVRLTSLDREPAEPGWLDPSEAARAARFVDPLHRQRYVARRTFTRRVLAEVTGCRPSAEKFDRSCEHCGHPGHGRPRLVPTGPHFSVSSAGDLAAIATCAHVEVGIDLVDLATVRPLTITSRLIEAAFGKWRADCSDAPGFAAAWARQEAIGKCWGYGLVGLPEAARLDTTSVEVTLDVPDRELLCAVAVRRPDQHITIVQR